jgi:hypothetical protein
VSTDLPYTEADLRSEAANQHAELTTDPDFVGVGESMQDTYVPSTVTEPDPGQETGSTWGELLPYEADGGDAFNAVQRKIHDLINGAADVSEWAVNLGADGLEPSSNVLGMEAGDTPIVRIHFAFHADMSEDARNQFVMRLGAAMADHG